jgi:hypothetical protein
MFGEISGKFLFLWSLFMRVLATSFVVWVLAIQ